MVSDKTIEEVRAVREQQTRLREQRALHVRLSENISAMLFGRNAEAVIATVLGDDGPEDGPSFESGDDVEVVAAGVLAVVKNTDVEEWQAARVHLALERLLMRS